MSVPLYKQVNGKIDLKQLRHAVAAADYGSFRQAAEALKIKQSTLSRSILQLEHATSIRLFERSPGGVAVSQSGSDFIRMAKAVLEQINEFDLLAIPSRAEVLRIGFCTSLSAGGLRVNSGITTRDVGTTPVSALDETAAWYARHHYHARQIPFRMQTHRALE